MKTDSIESRFAEAYREMAAIAKFRPEAPSDGLGCILLEPEELSDSDVLAAESRRYAERLKKQDDNAEFILTGCAELEHSKLFVYLLNASQQCFSGRDDLPLIKQLVQMSLEEISRVESL